VNDAPELIASDSLHIIQKLAPEWFAQSNPRGECREESTDARGIVPTLPPMDLVFHRSEGADAFNLRGSRCQIEDVGMRPVLVVQQVWSLGLEYGPQGVPERIRSLWVAPDRPPERQIAAVSQRPRAPWQPDRGIDPVESRRRRNKIEGGFGYLDVLETPDDDVDV
jgi:hypothetical protein